MPKENEVSEDQEDNLIDPEGIDEYQGAERALHVLGLPTRFFVVTVHVARVEVSVGARPRVGATELRDGCRRLDPVQRVLHRQDPRVVVSI